MLILMLQFILRTSKFFTSIHQVISSHPFFYFFEFSWQTPFNHDITLFNKSIICFIIYHLTASTDLHDGLICSSRLGWILLSYDHGVRSILPIWALPSIILWASAASDRGKVLYTIGFTLPAAMAGQTCFSTSATILALFSRLLFRRPAAVQTKKTARAIHKSDN